ncbi:MAG: ABC transporter permease [Anaerolineae bacterium]|jgi:ABC-2 type transport system permease protein
MRKSWLVAVTTYRRRVRSTAFLLLTFGLPLLMVAVGAISILTQIRGELPPVGYVDQTGQLATVESVAMDDGETLSLTSYPNVEAAQQALSNGEIDGYLVVPQDYLQEQAALPTFYGEKNPNAKLESALTSFMRRALLPDAEEWAFERLEEPSDVTFVARQTGETVEQGAPLFVRVATPAFLALFFVLTVFTSANQMGSAVVREKEQRAMEMVITSLSPRELVIGKVLGMTLLSLTQVGVWVIGAGTAAGLALFGTLSIQDLSVPWWALLWAVLLGVPTYFLYAVLGSGLGVIAGDKQQARQLAGMLGFLGMGPLYLMGAIIDNLGGPLSVGLTLFPLTAPTIALFRMTLSDVPTWQLITSFGIIIVSLIITIWAVARIFRAAMLMYGQSLRPRQIVRALREA